MIPILLSSLLIIAASAQEVTNYNYQPVVPATTSAAATTAVAAAISDGQLVAADSGSIDNYYGAAYATLTGAALSSEIATQDSEYYAAAYPSLTGTALSAAIASDNAAATAAYPTLTGTAAAAESAALASELSALESAYPSAYASAVPTGPVVDACGPKIPDPSVPDSCSTPVYEVGQPNAWGVQCLNDTGSSTAVNITSCATLIPELCSNQWQSPNQWVWLTADGCSIGSFLPGSNFAGHAPWPSNAQCEELIYASMVDSCQYSETPWNIAAVNIKVLPTDDTWAGTGEAVNVGYGSYIVAGRQLRTLSDQKGCTWIPRDDYCKGTACYPASYYQSKFQHPTLCAALSSPEATFTPAPKRRRALL